MKKVVVIGATGHVGSYLVPDLVKKGYQVTAITRGTRKAYGYESSVWDKVKTYNLSREELYSTDLSELTSADVVCDLIAYDVEGVKKIVSKISQETFYIQIGSIWTYENKEYLPVDENHPKNATQTYGKEKGLIEDYLLNRVKAKEIKAAVIHPGHVSGKEWQPINPQGNLDFSVIERIKNGEETVLPFYGLPTLQHVHSADLSRIITACIEKQEIANGQAFIAVAKRAMTLRAITEKLYAYYGKKPNIRFAEWSEFEKEVGSVNAGITWDHVFHSPCCSVEKAEKLLGVKMRYSIMDIYYEYLKHNQNQLLAKA